MCVFIVPIFISPRSAPYKYKHVSPRTYARVISIDSTSVVCGYIGPSNLGKGIWLRKTGGHLNIRRVKDNIDTFLGVQFNSPSLQPSFDSSEVFLEIVGSRI